MEDLKTRLSDLILKHLPAPPATVVAVGGEPADACSTRFRLAGYEVFRCFFWDTLTDPPTEAESDQTGYAAPPRYDAILFCGSPPGLAPLRKVLKGARELLKEKGMVLICPGMGDDPLMGQGPGTRRPSEVIMALYESGFAVQGNEWIEEQVNTPCSEEKQKPKGCCFVVGKKDAAFVRGYREGDETAILTMFKEVFKADRNMEHWYWKFRDNPFGAYKIVEAFAEDGTLAGHYSGYPVPFRAPKSGGEAFVSYQIGDIMTRPGFRQVGLANTSVLGRITDYFHHRFCLDTVPFMYGFVAGNHKRFGERFLRYSYMHPIPYHVLDAAKSRQKGKERAAAFLSGLSVKPVAQLTPEFDAFFQEASEGYGLLVQRDAAYLQWRYLDCPDKRHTLVAVRRFGRLAGWSVFSRRGEALIWGDALFPRTTGARTVKGMLDQVIRSYFPGITRIEGWFSPVPGWWTRLLGEMGFRRTEEPSKLVSGVTLFDGSFSVSEIEQTLYYTMGDSDLF